MYHQTTSHCSTTGSVSPRIFKHDHCLAIGRNLNILNPLFQRALIEKDDALLLDLARQQLAAGASGLDINPGPAEAMDRLLPWISETLDRGVATPLFLPANSAYLTQCLALQLDKPVITGVIADPEILRDKMELAHRYGAGLVVMLLRSGNDGSLNGKLQLALEVMETAEELGMDLKNLYFDPAITAEPDPVLHALRRGRPALDPLVESIRLLDALSGEKVKVIMELENILGDQGAGVHDKTIHASAPRLLADAGLDALVMDCCQYSQVVH